MSLQNGKIILARFIRDFVLDHKTGRSRQYGPVIVQSLLRFPFFFERMWAISQVCTYHYCFSILHRSTYIHNEFGQQKCAVENEVNSNVHIILGIPNVFHLNLIFSELIRMILNKFKTKYRLAKLLPFYCTLRKNGIRMTIQNNIWFCFYHFETIGRLLLYEAMI